MNEADTLLVEEIKSVVENQIRQNDPPETKHTYNRLISEGFSEDEVMKKLAMVVASEIDDVLKSNLPFNQERFIKRLNALPQEPE